MPILDQRQSPSSLELLAGSPKHVMSSSLPLDIRYLLDLNNQLASVIPVLYSILRLKIDSLSIDERARVGKFAERLGLLLSALQQNSLLPSRIVNLGDEPGIGLTFHCADRRAELEILDDGRGFLTMYGLEGAINVTEQSIDQGFEQTIVRIRAFLDK
jgi:hypothetical protein